MKYVSTEPFGSSLTWLIQHGYVYCSHLFSKKCQSKCDKDDKECSKACAKQKFKNSAKDVAKEV